MGVFNYDEREATQLDKDASGAPRYDTGTTCGSVGCTRQTIISIEKYRYTPSVELALKIARVLGMTVDELFEFEEENGK